MAQLRRFRPKSMNTPCDCSGRVGGEAQGATLGKGSGARDAERRLRESEHGLREAQRGCEPHRGMQQRETARPHCEPPPRR